MTISNNDPLLGNPLFCNSDWRFLLILLSNCNNSYNISYREYPNLFYLSYIQILLFSVLLIIFMKILLPNSSMRLAHHIDVLGCFSLHSFLIRLQLIHFLLCYFYFVSSSTKLELLMGNYFS
jgi:hypothetical protein